MNSRVLSKGLTLIITEMPAGINNKNGNNKRFEIHKKTFGFNIIYFTISNQTFKCLSNTSYLKGTHNQSQSFHAQIIKTQVSIQICSTSVTLGTVEVIML